MHWQANDGQRQHQRWHRHHHHLETMTSTSQCSHHENDGHSSTRSWLSTTVEGWEVDDEDRQSKRHRVCICGYYRRFFFLSFFLSLLIHFLVSVLTTDHTHNSKRESRRLPPYRNHDDDDGQPSTPRRPAADMGMTRWMGRRRVLVRLFFLFFLFFFCLQVCTNY